MHKDIKDDLRWRTGVVLEDSTFNSTAVVKADENDKKIYIFVNGEQKRDYFAVILDKFREINDDFEKMKAIERVPLPDEPEITVSYKHLIRLERKGVKIFIPDGSEKEYNVKELLGTVYVEDERKVDRITKEDRIFKEVTDTIINLDQSNRIHYSDASITKKIQVFLNLIDPTAIAAYLATFIFFISINIFPDGYDKYVGSSFFAVIVFLIISFLKYKDFRQIVTIMAVALFGVTLFGSIGSVLGAIIGSLIYKMIYFKGGSES